MNEFEIIKKYFAKLTTKRADVLLGIGDDAAIVKIPSNQELAITTDTLVAKIHFLESTSPADIGYKSLAVNLSDLAAMGATPAWATLAITLPQADASWIEAFCKGFSNLAKECKVELIGGDLTHGPLSITVQALGLLPKNTAFLRSAAKPSDLIYVTGTLGDAGLALELLKNKVSGDVAYQTFLLNRLNRPTPRIAIGEKLRDIAHAAIDISDGLIADLKHILEESKVGAVINIDALPLSDELKHFTNKEHALALALTAGDDYELCFTVPENQRENLEKKLASSSCRITCVGYIIKEQHLKLHYEDGNNYHGPTSGYQHF